MVKQTSQSIERPPNAAMTEAAVDVWSRWGARYRTRAIVLLIVDVVLFAGVGNFAFWLRSGQPFAPAMENYWEEIGQTFHFTGRQGVSLGSLLNGPISVQDVPILIPIIALLMATLISIPIMVAVLYRFWASLPFIAVVGAIAVMPWLAITLVASCVLASMRPFRSRFQFVSALLGLVPVVVYLLLAWTGTNETLRGVTDPIDQIKFVAPWVMAFVAAALVFAVLLGIAKVVNYRPGAVAPLLAVMFVLPVALFEFHVGRDELYYRLLKNLFEAHFTEVDASIPLSQAAQTAWDRHPLPRPSWEAVFEVEEQKWQFALASDLGPFQSELTRHQMEMVDRCDWFHRHFPDSSHALAVLFMKAQALDIRVDPDEFRETKWIRFYDDFPSQASREVWRQILVNQADSWPAAVARLRLAQLDAREGQVARATEMLEELVGRLRGFEHAGTAQEGLLKALRSRVSSESSFRASYDCVVLEASRLRDLLTKNRDPIYGDDPLTGPPRSRSDLPPFGFLDLDPRHARYPANLEALRAAYPNCQLDDNLELEFAKSIQDQGSRIQKLEACINRTCTSGSDAMAEALYRLGTAYKSAGRSASSVEPFTRLLREYPDSVWAQQASNTAVGSLPIRLTRVGT